MSATSALLPQEDDFKKLLAIASLTKEDIIAKGEETRKQLELTRAKEGEIAEAKAYIANHVALANDIQRREDELAANNKALFESKVIHSAHVASENTRLEAFAAKLDEKDKALKEVEKRLNDATAALASQKVEYDRQNAAVAQKNTDASNAHIAIGKELEKERVRLKDWEDTLKRKAEMARKTMAEF